MVFGMLRIEGLVGGGGEKAAVMRISRFLRRLPIERKFERKKRISLASSCARLVKELRPAVTLGLERKAYRFNLINFKRV